MPKTKQSKKQKPTESKTQKNTKNLTRGMEELTEGIEKSNSFSRVIMKGFTYGAATAIGATIIAAIVITILGKTINTVTDIPVVGDIIGDLIERTQIDSILENQINIK
jgi:hypothetical protein|tara:strand:+ start:210 stop:533 length:324 start_codon:yes stop_codon:yes gene_type:complete